MRIGIDLGGTKISAIAIDNEGRELTRERWATPADYPSLLKLLRNLVEQFESSLGSNFSVGIGTPGSVSKLSGMMKNCNTHYLNRQFLKEDLERALNRKVQLANDANCFALSEAIDGAASEASIVFGVILGTGVGGGLIHNRQCLIGPNSISGEWGHNTLPGLGLDFEDEQRRCYCGRYNCVETYLSGPGLSLSFQHRYGEQLTALDIGSLAEQGEARAVAVIDLYQQQLAAALSVVINIVDPDCVVLGGGVSNIASLYHQLPALLPATVFSDRVDTPIVKAFHGDDSGVRGAAWLWNETAAGNAAAL